MVEDFIACKDWEGAITAMENFIYHGVNFDWVRDRYEGKSKCLNFYIEQVENNEWVCFIYENNLCLQTEIAISDKFRSELVAIDHALQKSIDYLNAKLKLVKSKYNDAINCFNHY